MNSLSILPLRKESQLSFLLATFFFRKPLKNKEKESLRVKEIKKTKESYKALIAISNEMINTLFCSRNARKFFKLYHGEHMSISTANHIYGELKKRGYSVRKWALERDFSPRTVQECIHTYAPCREKKAANGTVAKRIMAALSVTLGIDLTGGEQ